MKLTRTRKLLEEKSRLNVARTYALIVHTPEDEAFIHSPDVDGDTFFDVASCGKVLHTSTLILNAVGRGLLRLDDRLSRFFPDVPAEKADVTIQQLLTHSSGIVRFEMPEEAAQMNHDQLAALMLAHPLAYEPGKGMQYSCNGMILLGFILEKLYGKPLDQVVADELAPLLGLTRTRFNIAVDEPNAALCYHQQDPGDSRCDDHNIRLMHGVGGSGGSFFSIRDVQKIVDAILRKDPKLYSEDLFSLAEQDYTPDGYEGRGLGYRMADSRIPEIGCLFPDGSFGHDGWTGQCFYIHRASGMYVILMSNCMRCCYENRGFAPGNYYDDVKAYRAEVHNAIYADLKEEGLL